MKKRSDILKVIAAYHEMGHTVKTAIVANETAAEAFKDLGLSVRLLKNNKPRHNQPSKYINKPRNNFKK